MSDPPVADDKTEQFSGVDARRLGLAPAVRFACPHCEGRLEVLLDTPADQIPCPSCGESVDLAGSAGEGSADTSTQLMPALTALGPYKLVERVGIGAFGAVWKAIDTDLGRTVAIKAPRTHLLAEIGERVFLAEARAAARLVHPHIVTVHTVGRTDGLLYIVSDFIHGEDLGLRMRRAPLGLSESVGLAIKLANALHHAHERGVVHRDIKPANVLLDLAGEPYLTDFGLARCEVSEVTLTADGRVVGTPAYMAPEQIDSSGPPVDRRADVYALGIVLYEMATRRLPFRGPIAEVLLQKTRGAPLARRFNPGIPARLEEVIDRCLQVDPARRYATADELATALRLCQEALRAEVVRPTPVPAPIGPVNAAPQGLPQPAPVPVATVPVVAPDANPARKGWRPSETDIAWFLGLLALGLGAGLWLVAW